jgi:dCTP diphosphatase
MPNVSGIDQSEMLRELLAKLEEFVRERDWDQFHTPKNLAISISIESAELLEHFQWVADSRPSSLTESKRGEVADEAADIYLYLLLFCRKFGIDLNSVALEKLRKNADRYPVRESYGTSTKYTELPKNDGS